MTRTNPNPKLQITRVPWGDDERAAVITAYESSATAEGFLAAYTALVPNATKRTVKALMSELLRAHLKGTKDRRSLWSGLVEMAHDEQLRRELEIAKDKGKLVGVQMKDVTATPGTPLKPVEPPPGPVYPLSQPSPQYPPVVVPAVVIPPVSTVPAPAKDTDALTEIADEVGSTQPPSVPPQPPRPPNFVKLQPDPNARVPRHFPMPTGFRARFSVADLAAIFKMDPILVYTAFASGALPLLPPDVHGERCLSHEDFLTLHGTMCDGYTFDEACKKVSESAGQSQDKLEGELMAPAMTLMTDPGQPETTTATVTGPNGELQAVLQGPKEVMDALFAPIDPPAKALEGAPTKTLDVTEVLKGVTPEQIKAAAKQVEAVVVKEVLPKATGCDTKLFALEAVRDGVLDVDTVMGLITVTDPARSAWALGALSRGKLTVEQASKLVK